jgi:7-cyano-7-deazaguanine reductase
MSMKKKAARSYSPKHLGRRSPQPIEKVDLIPWSGGDIEISLECDEFSSLCPVTGQPDFGSLNIRYRPRRHLVESKSLKLYLWHFRNEGVFNEELVARVADDLSRQIRPQWLEVEGKFNSRGGIAISARVERGRRG